MILPQPLILVVEDDRMTREMSSEAVRSAGMRTLLCESGEAAIEVISEQRPDLVVLDLTMPGISGIEVLRAIRGRRASEDLPVIVATGSSDPTTVSAAYRAGATDFVIKPIVYPILIERIRYMLKSSSAFKTVAAARRSLEDAQRLMRSGSWEWNARESSLWVSESLREMLSIRAETTDPSNLVELTRWVHPEDRSSALIQFRTCMESGAEVLLDHRLVVSDGEVLHVRQHVARVLTPDESVCGLKGVVLDRTKEERASLRADLWEHYDSNTGLPNRRLLLEHLDRSIETAILRNDHVAVVCLELDRASTFQSTIDDSAQRALLCAMAERLSNATRDLAVIPGVGNPPRAFLSHSRETQFTIALTHLHEERDAIGIARRLRDRLEEPYPVEDLGEFVGSPVSGGLSLFPNDGSRPGDLLRSAERALHFARERGGGRLEISSSALELAIDTRQAVERDLLIAFREESLKITYQPIVSFKTGRAVGLECRVGWRGAPSDLGTNAFTALSKQSGLIEPLGRWFIEASCSEARGWWSSRNDDIRLCIDVSPTRIRHHDFVADLEKTLRDSDMRPDRLELELDERQMGHLDRELQDALHALRSLGIRIVLDHFGTGSGSLHRWIDLSVAALKLDRSLLRTVVHPKLSGRRMIGSVVALAHDLGARVVADGVETTEALAILRDCDVDAVQGPILSSPVASNRVEDLLDRDLLASVETRHPFEVHTLE